MKIKTLICAVCLVCISLPASATNLFIEGGLHVGGDNLATATGGSGLNQNLRAGQLLSFAVGIHTELSYTLQSRVSVGYKADRITANNGSASFSRIPVEALLMYRTGNFMLGGGITYHLSPRFKFDVAPSYTVDFDNAVGAVLGFDYNPNGIYVPNWYIGGRVTAINYKVSGASVSGNSLGAVIGYMF